MSSFRPINHKTEVNLQFILHYKVQIKQTHKSGTKFAAGKTEVVYTAIDEDGNNNTCIINVIVQGKFGLEF